MTLTVDTLIISIFSVIDHPLLFIIYDMMITINYKKNSREKHVNAHNALIIQEYIQFISTNYKFNLIKEFITYYQQKSLYVLCIPQCKYQKKMK